MWVALVPSLGAEEQSFEERFFAGCPSKPPLTIHRDHTLVDLHGLLYTTANVTELEIVRLADWLIDLPIPGPEVRPIEHVFVGIRALYHRLGHGRPLARVRELADAFQLRELSLGDATVTYTVATGGAISPGSGTIVRVNKLIDWTQHIVGDLNEGIGWAVGRPRGAIRWALPGRAVDGTQWLVVKTTHALSIALTRTVEGTISAVERSFDAILNLPRGLPHRDTTIFLRIPLGVYRQHEPWILEHQDHLYAGTTKELSGLTHTELFHRRTTRQQRWGDLDRFQPPPSHVVFVMDARLFRMAPAAFAPHVIPAGWVDKPDG
ncbi:MAG: hypothetical protein HY595_05395 [Candidatus Omnitrophica bacterium]|nr:hypothetical protein [Candidatus Omnitrophota bacterium]